MPQYELNLRDYSRIFHKRKFVIISTFLIVTIVTMIYLSMQPPVYRSSTTVKIEERKTIAGLLTEWIVYNPGDVMASQTRIIKGFPIMKKVALRLGAINDNFPTREIHKVVSGLQNRIETGRVERTNIIRITASAGTAREAKDLAEAVTSVYIEENLSEKTRQARSARQFIEEQLSLLEDRLKDAEDRLREFKEQAGKVEQVDKKDEIRDMRLVEPIQKKLVDLKFRMVALLQRYTDKHPRIVRLKKQIKDLEAQLDEEMKSLLAQQEEEIKDLEGQQEGFPGQELEYARLARKVEINKRLYMMFQEKLEESRITEAQKVPDVSIVDPAVMPASPASQQKEMGMLIGGLMGLILGIALAFILETVDTSIGTIEDVERVVKLPVLGVVPSARSELKKKEIKYIRKKSSMSKKDAEETYIRLIVHHRPKSHVTEAYRNIRTNLKLGLFPKTILIASAGPLEGKTTIMINLGLTVAQRGARTLLVSTDLRRPAVARTFGIKREPGLNELLTGTISIEEALRNISDIMLGNMKFDEIMKFPGIENIWILPCGHLPSSPTEVLESRELIDLIRELKKRFDVIFFDSPPVLPVTDASLLAPKVDSVVLCYKIGKTARSALLRAKIQLESSGAKISGVILNHINPVPAPHPYYNYRYRYAEKDKSDKQKKV